jgi:hypothetical protein
MPPRYAYWTILVDNQPTAFRASAKDDLLPTFNRLKAKDSSAVMMWFQNGKLWPSRVDAQEAMLARGEMGRRGDARQAGGFRERHKVGARSSAPPRDRSERPEWKPKDFAAEGREPRRSSPASEGGRKPSDKLDWKPKGEFTPAPKRSERSERPDWKPKGSFDRERKPDWKPKTSRPQDSKTPWKPKGSFDRDRKPRSFARPAWKPSGDETKTAKPQWKPKGSFTRERKPDWKPKGSFDRDRKPEWRGRTQDSRPGTSRSEKPEWKPKGSFDRERKPEWKPKTSSPHDLKTSEKRKWVPKEEYKKSLGIEAKRDAKWRPGGAHRDPRQKYKDAKKAKWTKFKKTIRTKWEAKGKKKS